MEILAEVLRWRILTQVGELSQHKKGGGGANDCLDLTDQPNPITNAASNTENRPPFYTVVWIMRVR